MNHDPINNPSHYAEGRQFEPIDVIEDWELNFRLANTVKYISRAGRKKDILEDLRKARWYLDREIQHLEVGQTSNYVADDQSFYDDVLTYYGQSVDEKEAWPPSTVSIEVTDEDWEDFWSEDHADVLWDPSVGPVELSEKEIVDILAKKALDQFEDAEIVATVEKRGFILGIKKDGSTCELGGNGRCV
jgi:hypothetical protein